MEDILTTLARQFLPQMESEGKAEALRSLKRMIDEEFCNMAIGDQPERTENSCPRCGSWHVVKKGREPDGSQRYLCRSCTRTFTSRTNKVFATTKLDRATWMRFAECHVDVLPLRECAERCGVRLKTASSVDQREQICVLTGVNDAGDFFFEMAGRGNITEERAAAYLEGKVASGAIVATDGARAYGSPVAEPLAIRQGWGAEQGRSHEQRRVVERDIDGL